MLFPIQIPMTVYRTNKTSRESIRAIWYILVPNSKNIRTTVPPIHLKLACEKSTGAWCMELPLPYSLRNLVYRLFFNEMSPLFAILLYLIWSCQYPCNVLAIATCMCHPSTLIFYKKGLKKPKEYSEVVNRSRIQ